MAAPNANPNCPTRPFRVGHGYDLHRLEPHSDSASGAQPVRPLILGGVWIAHDRGPVAHSDGDALLHAVTDALLGALGEPDIGQLFPDTDPRHDAQDSRVFLHEAARRVRESGYEVSNLDATVILERPKLSPHKASMRANIAAVIGIDEARVNIKGKTHEKVDAVGEGKAVEVHVVVLLAASR
jgi:2-C-methyl-D-erythritol 2,4-cyclodiphosphate synthase